MNWLQNTIIIVISFLISRVMIDANMHCYFVNGLLKRSKPNISAFVSGILFSSYFLSLFFSNTVVVLTMIPIIKFMLEGIQEKEVKGISATILVLALIYGANIGGMGSLIGSALNIVYLGLIEFYHVPGRENITFFSWLIFGIPATLFLLFLSRIILRLDEKKIVFHQNFEMPESETVPRGFKKYLFFFISNILLIMVLTAVQFIIKPANILNGFNSIDVIFMIYLACFIFFAFIFPRGKKRLIFFGQNLVYLILFLLGAPFIAFVELLKEFRNRLKMPISGNLIKRLENWIIKTINQIWYRLFHEKIIDLKNKNKRTFVSINQLIYDLPFLGLIFMTMIIGLVYWLSIWGDIPMTPETDGYVIQFLEKISIMLIPEGNELFLFLLAINIIAVSFTQIINNTTILFIMAPLIIKIAANLNLSPVYFLLSVTMAASAAFMTPMASPVNAIAYAGVPGVSLKKMFKLGFFLTLVSCLWITVIFYIFDKFFL